MYSELSSRISKREKQIPSYKNLDLNKEPTSQINRKIIAKYKNARASQQNNDVSTRRL
jgi:hypothetical protein